METTIIIAKVLGIYYIVSGIFVLTHKKTLAILLKDMLAHRAITYIVGAFLVLGGAALIVREDVGTGALPIFITVISWGILIKGAVYMFMPDYFSGLIKNISKLPLTLIGILVTCLGVYLTFFI